MRRILAAIVCVVGLLAARALADDAGVGMQAAANQTAISPGGGCDIAITLSVPEGKHVYWKNPGDAGLATGFKFTPSAGVTVSEIEYPLPMKFVMGGTITDYGYQGEVTFLAHVTAAKTASEATIAIKGTWLCCDDHGCTPGSGETSIAIPVAVQGAPANTDLFAKAQSAMPAEKYIGMDLKSHRLDAEAAAGQINFDLQLAWKGKVKDVDLYPSDADGLAVENIQVKNSGSGTDVSFDLRPLAGAAPKVDKLPMLLVYMNEAGERRGFYIDAPLGSLVKTAGK